MSYHTIPYHHIKLRYSQFADSAGAERNDYLPTAGFALAHEKNHTQGAIVARDEDFE